jgi:hypothetical protein
MSLEKVSFEINVIKPFDGATLEIGGAVETYWKSMANAVSGVAPLHAISAWQRPSGSSGSTQTSPSNPSITGSAAQPMIISSLSGNYVYVVVQVTRDLHPVVFNNWMLPERRFDLGVADVTLSQFEALSLLTNRNLDLKSSDFWHQTPSLSHRMIAVAKLLAVGFHILCRGVKGDVFVVPASNTRNLPRTRLPFKANKGT